MTYSHANADYVCGPAHHLWTRWYHLRGREDYRYCRNCGKQNRRILLQGDHRSMPA